MADITTDKTIRIGLAGLGTVGMGVIQLLAAQGEDLFQKTGCRFEVSAVAARTKNKQRAVDLSHVAWVDSPLDLALRSDVDVVVEVMGGDGDPALSLLKAALKAHKPVVTANKALLAQHGFSLAQLSEDMRTPLLFEAAVAGGIPVIKALREGLAANRIDALYGILNGTCNYILSTMEKTGQSFPDVLTEAQKLGYVEADPVLDVGGGDSGHKLALLSALAFGTVPHFQGLSINGIEQVQADDIVAANDFDYRIKLIAQAKRLADGRLLQMVAPTLVPKSSPLAHIGGALNGIEVMAQAAGASFMAGRGAGAGPTASAVVADLIDITSGRAMPWTFGRPSAMLEPCRPANFEDWSGGFYLRLVVRDEAGVLADIAPILRDHAVSIESMVQRGQSSVKSAGQPVKIIILTHDTTGKAINGAIAAIAKLNNVLDTPFVMPVLTL